MNIPGNFRITGRDPPWDGISPLQLTFLRCRDVKSCMLVSPKAILSERGFYSNRSSAMRCRYLEYEFWREAWDWI